jgi:hypothetical protein
MSVVPTNAAERRHRAWTALVDCLLDRLPTPLSFGLVPDGETAVLVLARRAHVEEWASYLALPAPTTHTSVVTVDGYRVRVTRTRAAGALTPDTWLVVEHTHREPATGQDTARTRADDGSRAAGLTLTAGEGGGRRG